ncbi:MAG: divalent cation tolerance protein CutA [Candidatus Woesearchaeota archaeon]|nr:divalent cation tolerance protein CutA [Candidatus Woesearchaeota archaeon]
MMLIYITCKDEEEARKISMHLVKNRLAACTNMFPIRSFYWWKDKIEETDEYVVLAKTIDENYEKIKKEVKKIHSYEVPCIMKMNVDVNEEYGKWVEKETKQ